MKHFQLREVSNFAYKYYKEGDSSIHFYNPGLTALVLYIDKDRMIIWHNYPTGIVILIKRSAGERVFSRKVCNKVEFEKNYINRHRKRFNMGGQLL